MNQSVSFQPIDQGSDGTGRQAKLGGDALGRYRPELKQIEAPKVVASDAERLCRAMVKRVDSRMEITARGNDVSVLNPRAAVWPRRLTS